MATELLPPPVWISSPPSLWELVGVLAVCRHVAVDTESNSLHAFREKLCLLQFSTLKTDYLVDPLALEDLSPLASIFADPHIEKVFHAVEYDLICLRRDFNMTINNIFDTMQAARILGYKQVGLDSILAEKLGVKLNKKYQKADWGERPLSQEMLNYARLDTHHLLDLRDKLHTELKARGRWELAQEEFIRLAHGNGNSRIEIPAWQRVKGAQKFTDRQLTILQELCTWREKQAKSLDRPLFKVIDDRRLVAITQALPETQENLVELGLTVRQINLYGNEILKAVKRGHRSSLVTRPRALRPDQEYLDRLNVLSEWRKTAGLKLGVESDLVLPRHWLHIIAEKNPKSLVELSSLMPSSPWRLDQFGEQILSALSRKYIRSVSAGKK